MPGHGCVRRMPRMRLIPDLRSDRVFLADAVREREDRSDGESEGQATDEASALLRRGSPSSHVGSHVIPIRTSASSIRSTMKTSSMRRTR